MRFPSQKAEAQTSPDYAIAAVPFRGAACLAGVASGDSDFAIAYSCLFLLVALYSGLGAAALMQAVLSHARGYDFVLPVHI